MAVDTTTFSGKQFSVYIASEHTATGTFETTDASFRKVDVIDITYPSFAPSQEFEKRSGAGRLPQFADIFSNTKRHMTEFTLSGRLTQELWVILMENVSGDEFDGGTGSDSVMTLGNDFAGLNFKVGDDPDSATDFANLLSIYFSAPTVADSYSLASCFCTSLNITADMDSNGGLFNFTATFQTYSAPAKAEQSGLVAAAGAVGTHLYLGLWDETNIDIKGTAGADDIDPLFKSFNMTYDSPVEVLGQQGTNAEPEVWLKGMPEVSITWGGSIKYDATTDQLVEAYRDAAADSYVTLFLSDVAVAGNTETPTGVFFAASSVVKFGMWFGKSKLTSCEVSSEDLAMVNFEAIVTAPASGNAAHFLGGDNV